MLDELRDTPEVLYGAVVALGDRRPPHARRRRNGATDRCRRPAGRRRASAPSPPVPRLGGLAIFLGIIVPSLAFLDLSGEMRGILLGAAVACVVGAIDDFRGLAPAPKLAGQVVAAAIPTAFGVWIDHFTFPFLGAVDLPAWLGVPLTIVWIVAVMNMVNFLDGIDGLAAGVCAISGVTFSVLALSLGKADAAILSAVVAGACIGFLRHNFFPARIFMGDSGALCWGTRWPPSPLRPAQDRVHGRPLPAAARARGTDRGHVVRGRQAAEARSTGLLGRPLAPAPPLRQHRLLAAAGGADDVGLVRHAGGGGARDALRPLPRRRRLASVGDVRRRRRSALVALAFSRLHRLPARDRQARESAHPPA